MGYFADGYFDSDYWDPGYWGTDVTAPAATGCWIVLPDGQQPTGPEDGGRQYPFVAVEDELLGILADASLSHQVLDAQPPLALTWLYGLDRAVNCGVEGGVSSMGGEPTATHPVDVLINDVNGLPVFDSTLAAYYAATPIGDRLLQHEWRTLTAVCRLIQHTAVARAGDERLLPRVIEPVYGALDERVSTRVPLRLDGMFLQDGSQVSADVTLWSGYNVTFSVKTFTRGVRRVNQVTVNAAPGGGIGRAPACDGAEVFIRTINGVPGDAGGNFLLGAQACNYLRPPASGAPNALELGYDCQPCCTCQDYENVQAGVLGSWNVYADTAATSAALVGQLRTMIARWDARKAALEALAVRINALPHWPYVEVAASVCNSSLACLDKVKLEVDAAIDPQFGLSVDPRTLANPYYPADYGSALLTNSCGVLVPMGAVASGPPNVLASLLITRSVGHFGFPAKITGRWSQIAPAASASLRFRLFVPTGATTVYLSASATYVADDVDHTVVTLPGNPHLTFKR
jgi:hypothetical protein